MPGPGLVLNNALDVALQVIGTEAGGMYLPDEGAHLLKVRALRGFSSESTKAINGLGVGEGYSGRVIQTGQPMVVKDVAQDERLSRSTEWRQELRSMAIAPLSSKGGTLGVMFAATEGADELTDRDLQLLTFIGHQIGAAIENARLFSAEQRRAEQFRLVGEVGRRITSILVIDELLSQIVRLVAETLGYYRASIALVEGDDLVFTALVGPGWKQVPGGRWGVKVGEGVTGWASFTWPTGSRPPCTPCGRGSHHWTVRPRFRVRHLS